MSEQIGKFKIMVECDGEKVETKIKGAIGDVALGLCQLIVEVLNTVPEPFQMPLLDTMQKTVIHIMKEDRENKETREVNGIEDVIAEVFKN